MSVSGISNLYKQLSSGYKINSAADNAAGLAIVNKLISQVNGYDTGADNAASGQDLLNTADGALSGIQDSLQRMRELSVQASNGIYGSDEKAMIQEEISQLKQSITDTAKGTQFNTMNLLDGSMADLHLATNPDGTGMSIQMSNHTLASLGIEDYDVTGSFDISKLDEAISMVSSARSNYGSATNALDHTISYNKNASYNLTAAQSRIQDTDYGTALTELETQRALEAYRMNMQKKQAEQQKQVLRLFE